jgi:hypothetical protein
MAHTRVTTPAIRQFIGSFTAKILEELPTASTKWKSQRLLNGDVLAAQVEILNMGRLYVGFQIVAYQELELTTVDIGAFKAEEVVRQISQGIADEPYRS